MKKKSVFFSILLAVLFIIISACNNGADKSSSNLVRFSSSDKNFDLFMNEFFMRHVREGDLSVGDYPLGAGSLYAKEWETISLMWFDSKNSLSDNKMNRLKFLLEDFPVDKYGYMWGTGYELLPGMALPIQHFGQGWPFPDYPWSAGNAQGWEFNARATLGFNSNAHHFESTGNGFVTAKYKGAELNIESPNISVNTFHAPFIELDLRVTDNDSYGNFSEIEDIYISWKNNESNEWHTVSQKEWSTMPIDDIPAYFARRMYFPMYKHPQWNGHTPEQSKTVTNLRISVKTKGGKTVDLTAEINYLRLSYDSRQSNWSTIYISYLKQYLDFINDTVLLEKVLNKARMAMQFNLTHLKGYEGLIDLAYFVGKDGKNGVGHGIGNSYWDILTVTRFNFETNIRFYKALQDMAAIEIKAAEYGIDVAEPAVVVGPQNSGNIIYSETPQTLLSLAETVKQQVTEEFWDQQKGRFIWGRKADGTIMDYGYTVFNLEAIEAGLASEHQKEQILSWISGERIIEGELSTGKDIYYYEFAPRTSTLKNSIDYMWRWNGFMPFANQVQDGGAILYVSYYDLMSRLDYYGPDNAFKRLKEIQNWYQKVKQAGGEGNNFYRRYYDSLGLQMQGGDIQGGIGIDYEFLESCLIYNIIPLGFLGLNGTEPFTLNITPQLPKDLSFIKVENLHYDGILYDIKITNNSVEISNVRGNTQNRKIKVNIMTDKNLSISGTNAKIVSENGLQTVSFEFSSITIKY